MFSLCCSNTTCNMPRKCSVPLIFKLFYNYSNVTFKLAQWLSGPRHPFKPNPHQWLYPEGKKTRIWAYRETLAWFQLEDNKFDQRTKIFMPAQETLSQAYFDWCVYKCWMTTYRNRNSKNDIFLWLTRHICLCKWCWRLEWLMTTPLSFNLIPLVLLNLIEKLNIMHVVNQWI